MILVHFIDNDIEVDKTFWKKIIGFVTQTMLARQTLLWSATLPTALERLARSAVLNAVRLFYLSDYSSF